MRLTTSSIVLLLTGVVITTTLVLAFAAQSLKSAEADKARLEARIYQLERDLGSLQTTLAQFHRQDRMAVACERVPWVVTTEGKLAARLWTEFETYSASSKTIHLALEVKNTSGEPMTLRAPEIMWHTGSMRVEGPLGALQYVGLQILRTPPPLVEVLPGKSIQRVLDLDLSQFRDFDKPGKYRLVYIYSTEGKTSGQEWQVETATEIELK